MAKMMKPEAEITRFAGGIDVIATSGNPTPTLTLSGFNNLDSGDATASLGNAGIYNTNSTNDYDTIKTSMNSYLGRQSGDFQDIKVQYNAADNAPKENLNKLFEYDGSGWSFSWFNGTFTYDPTITDGYIWFTR